MKDAVDILNERIEKLEAECKENGTALNRTLLALRDAQAEIKRPDGTRIAELEAIIVQQRDGFFDQEKRIAELEAENERLLTLATKWCNKNHHDWLEILKIGGFNGGDRK